MKTTPSLNNSHFVKLWDDTRKEFDGPFSGFVIAGNLTDMSTQWLFIWDGTYPL